jgi:hypothetical protein
MTKGWRINIIQHMDATQATSQPRDWSRRDFLKHVGLAAGALAFRPLPTMAELSKGESDIGSARLIRINGIPTLEVEGRPFLLVGAQCDIWRSTRQDAKTAAFFDGYRDMNATCVSVGIPWSKTEPVKDCYEFHFLDWFVEQAQKRGLKLVLNLFNTNVCGKVQEGSGSSVYPGYAPTYILDAPVDYQRMVLPGPYKYNAGGPPMCPNDPRTLERERRLCVKVAEHLKQTDINGTVIMLQIDNEFYYQQWDGDRPQDEKSVRCHCRFCEEKWKTGTWKDGEDFMFHSFADYVKVLTDAITECHPLPMYINSPWWPPYVVPIFLKRCPNLALVGVDGVFAPNEPNMLSRSQLGRNIPFAAENPTENPKTRLNLDVLPYYTILGQQGIGNLLWESGPPHTIVEDPQARLRCGAALYPIRWAQVPIANARGTENLVGWFAIRDIATDVTTDIFGNFVPVKEGDVVTQKNRLFVREGSRSRMVETDQVTTTLGDLHFEVSVSAAGIIARIAPARVILAIPKGHVAVAGPRPIQATEGRFDGAQWLPDRASVTQKRENRIIFEIKTPQVILLEY